MIIYLKKDDYYEKFQSNHDYFWNFSSITLFVDDKKEGSGELESDDTIGGIDAQLFLGGLDPAVKVGTEELLTSNKFSGCISELFVNFV